MKTYFLGLALAAFVSAVAIQGLQARTTTPPVFVVVEIDEITDADGFEALRQAADATAIEVQFEDGRYFARTENVWRRTAHRSFGHACKGRAKAIACATASGPVRAVGSEVFPNENYLTSVPQPAVRQEQSVG
jgi:hypothetical protein